MSEENKPARRQYRRTTERRQEILVAVVQLLSDPDCWGVTTKDIARFLGIADGALYRHFSGKAEILEELIGFCDASFERMFDEINTESNVTMVMRAMVKARALLLFAEANSGLTRLLTGEALCLEGAQVRESMQRCLAKAEKALCASLELAVVQREVAADINPVVRARLIMSYVQGRWVRFVASGFEEKPTEDWAQAQVILFSDLVSA